jgi:peptide deformylase
MGPRQDLPSTFRILQYPKDAPLLRRKARPIREDEFKSDALYTFAARLAQTMKANDGLGLAATQVQETLSDDGQPWRMFAMHVDDGQYGIFCNPHIVMTGEYSVVQEGCLSFAKVLESMRAPEFVVLQFQNTDGVEARVGFNDMSARAIFHEVEHLDGNTMLERMSSLKRAGFLKSVAKARGRR